MLKINKIKLFKLQEAAEILKIKYNYQIGKQNLCTKISKLKAYVIYKGTRYIPEEVFPNLITNLQFKETRMATQIIVDNKIKKITKITKEYEKKYPSPPTKTITEIRSQNTNTQTIIKAVIQLQQEMANLKNEIQEKNQTQYKE